MHCIALALCVVTTATPAIAQQHQTTGSSIVAGAHATVTRIPHGESPSAFSTLPDLSGVTAGAVVGAGTFVRPSVTLRIEFSASGELEGEIEQVLGGGALEQLYNSGVSPQVIFGIPAPPIIRVRRTLQDRDLYVLAGYHMSPQRRVRLGYLAGAALRFTRTSYETADYQLSFGSLPPRIEYVPRTIETTSYSYGAALALGLDADIALSNRIGVAPHVRAVADSGTLSIRPGVLVRWALP